MLKSYNECFIQVFTNQCLCTWPLMPVLPAECTMCGASLLVGGQLNVKRATKHVCTSLQVLTVPVFNFISCYNLTGIWQVKVTKLTK